SCGDDVTASHARKRYRYAADWRRSAKIADSTADEQPASRRCWWRQRRRYKAWKSCASGNLIQRFIRNTNDRGAEEGRGGAHKNVSALGIECFNNLIREFFHQALPRLQDLRRAADGIAFRR